MHCDLVCFKNRIFTLREAEDDLTVTDICCKHATIGNTICEDMNVNREKELRQMYEENFNPKKSLGVQ